MFDTHCHLNFQAFAKDIPETIDRAKKAGVTKIVIPGADLESSKKAVEIAKEYEGCFAAVGIHPHHVDEFGRDAKYCVSTLKDLARQQKVVAIGEVGLDYYQYKDYPPISEGTKEKQKELFLAQIKIVQELKLPVIVHCREAWEEIITLMIQFIKELAWKPKGVFHCYSGGKKWLKKTLELGFYFGIDGNVTYDEGLQNVVKEIPLEKLLLETDSPFLTPIPFRRQRNEPKNIKIIAEKIAEIKNLSLKELEKQIKENTNKLFSL